MPKPFGPNARRAPATPSPPIDVDALLAAGLDLIPLHPWNFRDGKGRDRGKSPRDERWRTAEYARADLLAWVQRGGNIGVRLGDVDLVIDWDPRNAPHGYTLAQLLLDFELEFGIDLAKCPQVVTGSGGRHFYLRLPGGERVLNSLPAFPGVEFKSLGRQVVAVGSRHPNGNAYDWADGSPPLAQRPEAPAVLRLAIRRPERPTLPGAPSSVPFERAAQLLQALDVQRFRDHDAWLEVMMAFHAATGGSAEGLEAFVAWSTADPEYADHAEVIRERWASLSPDRGVTAGTLFWWVQATRGSIPHAPAAGDFAEELDAVEAEPAIGPRFDRADGGKPRPTMKNAVAAVAALGIEPQWDTFRHRVVFRGDLAALRRTFPAVRDIFDDGAATAVAGVLRERWGLELPLEKVHQAIIEEAHRNPFDSAVDYFDRIRWDGKPRLDRWLTVYAGAPESDYTRAVGRLLILGAVGRAYWPGVKFDSLVILEGPQGALKSSLLKALGGEWAAEGLPKKPLGHPDVIDAMQGYLIVELEELSAMRRSDVEAVKGFISRTKDRARLAYGRATGEFPRRCIFVGTTNDDSYLRDHTGNRRFLPVRVGRIDLAAVARDRDQLWAEGVAVWKAKPSADALVLPQSLWAVAAEEQEQRHAEDPWLEHVERWLKARPPECEAVASVDVLRDACGRPVDRQGQEDWARLRSIMGRLGWVYGNWWVGRGARVRGYRRPERP